MITRVALRQKLVGPRFVANAASYPVYSWDLQWLGGSLEGGTKREMKIAGGVKKAAIVIVVRDLLETVTVSGGAPQAWLAL